MPTMAPAAVAVLSQNVSGSSQRGSISLAVGRPMPRSAAEPLDLEIVSDTTSENTQVPIAKYASRRRNRNSATTAATAAQTSGATGSTQNGARFSAIEVTNRL